MNEEKLTAIRHRIDELDQQIQTLIAERAKCAQEVAKVKGENATAVEYYRAEREAEVLRNVIARNEGPLSNEEMARLFR